MTKQLIILATLGAAATIALASCSTQIPESTLSPSASKTSESQTLAPESTKLADLTADMALTAEIPSMCGFPAGKLVDGKLPKKHPEYPSATAPNIVDKKLILAGDLTQDGVGDLAVAFYCDMGGVAWPSQIQMFENTDHGIAALGKPFNIGMLTGGARGVPESLTLKDGKLALIDKAMRDNDAFAAPSGKIKATLAWNGKQLAATTFEDLADGDGKALETSKVNGTWCPVPESVSASSDCLTILFPEVTRGKEDSQSVSYWINGQYISLSYYDAPLGTVYPKGARIEDPNNSNLPTKYLDHERIYNGQTQEFFVRKNK